MDLQELIAAEANRQIRRQERSMQRTRTEQQRRARRTIDIVSRMAPQRPTYWQIDRGFDPYLVRTSTSRISHSIKRSLKDGTYQPRNPVKVDIPKDSGEARTVSIFQVADTAISRDLYLRLTERNNGISSHRSFAYRPTISSQDAADYAVRRLLKSSRRYVATFDFKAFFDTVNHESVTALLRERFFLTRRDLSVISSFMRVDPQIECAYDPTSRSDPSLAVGLPQGTAISHFLANVAAWPLDSKFEEIGVGFARYADDLVLWSSSYSGISQAVSYLYTFCDEADLEINWKKSTGIRLLSSAPTAEFGTTSSIEFVSYAISPYDVTPNKKAEQRFKSRVEGIIWEELVAQPTRGTQDLGRLGIHVDRDYVSCIWKLRHLLYGDVSEGELRKLLRAELPERKYGGLLANYPLATDPSWFSSWDGWLLSRLHDSLQKRALLLKRRFMSPLPRPHSLSRMDLISFSFRSMSTGQMVDCRVPSCVRMANLVTTSARLYGPSLVGSSSPSTY